MNKIKNILKNIFVIILPQRIWTRSLLILLVTMFSVEIIALYVFHDRHWRFVNYKLNDSLASEVTYLYRALENDSNYLKRYNQKRNNVFDIKITLGKEDKFKKLSKIPKSKQRIRLERSLNNYLQRPFRLAYYGNNDVAIGVPSEFHEEGYYFFVVPKGRVFDNSIALFLYWLVVSGVALSFLAGYFLYRQVRPMVKLSAMADNFGKGRYWRQASGQIAVREIPVSGAREIRMVARSFNQMMKRISYQIKQRTIMLAGVSHDLRTPITKLRLNLAFLEEDKNKKNSEVINKMRENLADMEKMISLYLQFAKNEDDEPLTTVKVVQFINDIVNEWQGEIKRNKKSISAAFNLTDDATLLIRSQAMRRCLNNIIANGLKNASEVKLNVTTKDDKKTREHFIIIDIADNGKGVPVEDREKIFEAFYQVRNNGQAMPQKKKSTTARGAHDTDQGFGLGLAIARDIVLGHGGNISVGDAPGGGALFTISLPV
ncbi:MAG: HAMP domain-containing sensor histidine kinase [Hydrotalea sp.]|nr:HAMP domain-containing sensor histidine kinase [Hydrotalea sp.]